MWSGEIYDEFKQIIAVFRTREDFNSLITKLAQNYHSLYVVFKNVPPTSVDMEIERRIMH